MEKMGKRWKQWKQKKRRKLTSRDAFGYARHLKTKNFNYFTLLYLLWNYTKKDLQFCVYTTWTIFNLPIRFFQF